MAFHRALLLRSFRTSVRIQSGLSASFRPFLGAGPISRQRFHVSATLREGDFDPSTIERESDEVDVCIVGGGPAGLSAAIRLKQLAEKEGREFRVVLLEKGSEIGNIPFTFPI